LGTTVTIGHRLYYYVIMLGFGPICLTCGDGRWRRMAAVCSASRISIFVSLWWAYPDGQSAAFRWHVWFPVLQPRYQTLRARRSGSAWIWSLWKTDIRLCLDLRRREKNRYSTSIYYVDRDLITKLGMII